METISAVTSNPPKLAPKSTSGAFTGFFLSFTQFVSSHTFLALGMVLGAFTLLVLFGRSRRRRSYGKGGFINLNEKEGLLGGMGNGGGAKHD
jgi:protein disulfide-isomerase